MTRLLTVRQARPRDVRWIAHLARDEIQQGHRWSWNLVRVAGTLARPDVLGAVGGDAESGSGFAIAKYGFNTAHLLLLAVSPTARRTGLGSELLQWHVECARVAGISSMRLELRAQNTAALAFYEAQGFAVVRRLPGYYPGGEDAFAMSRRLFEG